MLSFSYDSEKVNLFSSDQDLFIYMEYGAWKAKVVDATQITANHKKSDVTTNESISFDRIFGNKIGTHRNN